MDAALQKLLSLPEADQLIALEAFEENRKKKHAARYWASEPGERFKIFNDTLEDDFSKFTSDIKIYGLLGGNRSGKTERGAFLAVAWLMGREYFRDEPAWRYVKDLPIPDAGVNIWCVGLDFSVIRDVLWNEKLRVGTRKPGILPATPSPLVTRVSDSDFSISVDVNGRKSTLTCKSAESGRDKFQSASIDLAWIDEECDAEVFDEIFQRTIDCAGRIVLTLTPLADISSGAKRPWVYQMHKSWQQGQKDLFFVKINTLLNPYIPEDEKEKLKLKWAGHPEEGARLYGDFIRRGGLVYECWDPKVHFIKPILLERDWRRIVSIDPAATGTTAVVWAAISPRNDVYVYRLYYEKNKPVSDHCKDILIRNGSDPVDIWLLDPFWGTQRNAVDHRSGLQLFRENGIPVRLAPKEEDYGREIMREYLTAALDSTSRHPKLYIFDRCTPLKDEIEAYVWDTYGRGALKGQTKEKPVKRNDHAINALQYLLSLKPKGKRGGSQMASNANCSYT